MNISNKLIDLEFINYYAKFVFNFLKRFLEFITF